MNTENLKQKIVEVIDENVGFNLLPHRIEDLADQLLSLFSQSQAEQIKEIEKLQTKFEERESDEFDEGCEYIKAQVLSILKEK